MHTHAMYVIVRVLHQTLAFPIYEAPFYVDDSLLEQWPYIAPALTSTPQRCINPQVQRNLVEQRKASAKAKGKAKAKAKAKGKAAAKEKARAKAKTEGKEKKPRQDTPYNIERKKFFKKLLSCIV